ncbi:MAG: type II toxin-antitoxin system VapC family toxin [Candidatus Bathyarchaeota archaeon]
MPPTSVYIDTNIFDYVALRHPKYGPPCKRILDDVVNGGLKAHCSQLVPIEILGSLSRIDRDIAFGAVLAFYSFPIAMIPLTERIIRDASALTLETGVGYDAVHAAAMRSRGLKTVVTEDVDHWKKLGVEIVRPLEY